MKRKLLLLTVILAAAEISTAQLSVSPDSLVYLTESTFGNYCYKHRFLYTVTDPSGPTTFKFTFPASTLKYNLRIVKAASPSANLNMGDYLDTTITYQTPFSFRIEMAQNTNFKPAGTYQADIHITDINNGANKFVVPVVLKLAPTEKIVYDYISGPNNYYYSSTGLKDSCDVSSFKPTGTFSPPARGGSYIDPHFGAKVTIVSDTAKGITNNYGTPSSISAHNKYIILHDWYNQIPSLTTPSGAAINGFMLYDNGRFASGQDVWDAYNDSIMYGFWGSQLYRLNVITLHAELWIDYAAPPFNYTHPSTGGTCDATKDNYWAFWDEPSQHICAVDLTTRKTYVRDYSQDAGSVGWNTMDYCELAKGWDAVSGKRYLVMVTGDCLGVFSIDTLGNKIDFEYRGPESLDGNDISNNPNANFDGHCDPGEGCLNGQHSTTVEDDAGNQYLIMEMGAYWIYTGQLNALLLRAGEQNMMKPMALGGGKRIIKVSEASPKYPSVPFINSGDFQVGAARSSPFFCSATASFGRPINDLTSYPIEATSGDFTMYGMFKDKIVIRKVMKHRSIAFTTYRDVAAPYDSIKTIQYFAYAKPNLSPDGSLALSCSNFGIVGQSLGGSDPNMELGSSSIRTFCAETQANQLIGIKKINPPPFGANSEVIAMPNPSNGITTIKYLTEENAPTKVSVINIIGQEVVSKTIAQAIGYNSYDLSCDNLPKGTYIVQVINGPRIKQTRITID